MDLGIKQNINLATFYKIPFADFRSAFLDDRGKGRRELFFDGLHPTAEGHALMARVLCDTLARLEGHL